MKMKAIYERFGKLFLELGKIRIAKWKKLEPKKKILETKGLKILASGIKSTHELTLSGSLVSEISELRGEFSFARKEQTNLLDLAKKEISSKESEITNDLSDIEMRLTKLNNEYILKLEKKALMQEQKINKEKNERIERQSLVVIIHYRYLYAMQHYLKEIKKGFKSSWNNLTKEDFEQRMTVLRKYNPKIEDAQLNSFLEDISPSFITKEEAIKIIKENFKYEEFKAEYIEKVNHIKRMYLELVEEKKSQLFGTASDESLALLKQKEDAIELEKVYVDNDELVRDTTEKINDIGVKEELETQHKIQAIERPLGRRSYVAVLSGEKIDWNSIMNFYIEKNGTKKLDFITANLVKNGMPEIEGVKYEEKIINVNRKK